jgi:hypothetical protein
MLSLTFFFSGEKTKSLHIKEQNKNDKLFIQGRNTE